MSDKWKGLLSISVFTLAIFMMIETKYSRPLGNLILEGIGLKAWSNGESGFHLSILYFGFIAVLSAIVMMRNTLKMKGVSIFLTFIILMTSFTFLTSATSLYLKSQSEGLNALALVNNDNSKSVYIYTPNKEPARCNFLKYETQDFKVTDFELDLTIKNYGKRAVTFLIEIPPTFFEEDETVENFEIRNKDGSMTEFTIEPGKTHHLVLTDDTHQLTGGMRGIFSNYDLSIDEVILSNTQGESMLLSDQSIFAVLLIQK